MKIACSKEELVSALSVVSRAVSTRSTVQVLSGILLRAQGGQIELAATDMELSVRLGLDAQVEAEGSVVAPGRLLVDLARLLPDAEVTLEYKAEEGVLDVVSGPSVSRLHTYSAEDFPKLPEAEAAETFAVDRATFLETVTKVARAASRDESRPVLTGILVRFEVG
jgi:DNA polymerase-3 subunit beta